MALPEAEAGLARDLRDVGYSPRFVTDPYAAVVELATATGPIVAVALSLPALRAGETSLIEAIRRRYPGVDVIVTDVDGRAGVLAEAVRLGANALLLAGQLHRLTPPAGPGPAAEPVPFSLGTGGTINAGILTQAELRALLQDV